MTDFLIDIEREIGKHDQDTDPELRVSDLFAERVSPLLGH